MTKKDIEKFKATVKEGIKEAIVKKDARESILKEDIEEYITEEDIEEDIVQRNHILLVSSIYSSTSLYLSRIS